MIRRRFRFLPIGLLLLGFLSASSLFAQEDEYETNMKQARFFIKKQWYRDAVKELRRAVSTPNGRESFEAHLLLSQACFKAFDIGCAMTSSDKARGFARNPDEKNSAQGMMDYLTNNFGKVEFQVGPNELAEGYLELKPKEPILDKDVKEYFKEKVEPLSDQRRTLPWIMYLPAIEWELHGQTFTVEGGKELAVNAGFNAVNAKPKPPKAPPPPEFAGMGVAAQVRVGAGATLMNGESLNFGPLVDVSVHKAFGDSLMVGGFANANLASRSDGAYTVPEYGVIGTWVQGLSSNLALLPALGWSFGATDPHLYTDCSVSSSGGNDLFQCGPSQDNAQAMGNAQAMVNALSHGPVIRVEAAWRKRSKSSILMAHLGLQTHYSLGPLGGTQEDGAWIFKNETNGVTIKAFDSGFGRSLRLELLAGANMTF